MKANATLANSHKTVHAVLEALILRHVRQSLLLDVISRLRNMLFVRGRDVSFLVRVR